MTNEIKPTITTIFIVPTLKIDRDRLKENNFLNAYSHDKMREKEYTDCVFLLFKPTHLDNFRLFLDEEYERTKSVIEDYDHDGNFVVVVYKLDSKFKEDYKLIRKGKYSKTSKEFQKLFPKTLPMQMSSSVKKTDEISLQFRIFNKTSDLVEYWEKKFDVIFGEEQEVWRGWETEKETLSSNVLSSYLNTKTTINS